jgi:hypothetical protein
MHPVVKVTLPERCHHGMKQARKHYEIWQSELSSGSDSFRVSHHYSFSTIYVFQNKRRQRSTSSGYQFIDS